MYTPVPSLEITEETTLQAVEDFIRLKHYQGYRTVSLTEVNPYFMEDITRDISMIFPNVVYLYDWDGHVLTVYDQY